MVIRTSTGRKTFRGNFADAYRVAKHWFRALPATEAVYLIEQGRTPLRFEADQLVPVPSLGIG